MLRGSSQIWLLLHRLDGKCRQPSAWNKCQRRTNNTTSVGSPEDQESPLQYHFEPTVSSRGPSSSNIDTSQDSLRQKKHLETVVTSWVLEDAWSAFEAYKLSSPKAGRNWECKALHRLLVLLSQERPRTRKNFIRMLDVFQQLYAHGKVLKTWQWNTLIHYAGNGFRCTTPDDYRSAFQVFQDMQNYRRDLTTGETDESTHDRQSCVSDAFTYTTLFAISAQARSEETLRHATKLLQQSQLPPHRCQELAILTYFAHTGELDAAIAVIQHTHECGLEVGIDGLNSLMWVHACNGSFDLPLGIYRTLRRRSMPKEPDGILLQSQPVTSLGSYNIPEDLTADTITYTLLIQCLAYHGDLTRALEVFRDLMSLPTAPLASIKTRKKVSQEPPLAYLLPIYRSLFLGFYRHGQPSGHFGDENRQVAQSAMSGDIQFHSKKKLWNVETLQVIFSMFIENAQQFKPSGMVIYWIAIAFWKTTRGSFSTMSSVWRRLDRQFVGQHGWGGRMKKLHEKFGTDSTR